MALAAEAAQRKVECIMTVRPRLLRLSSAALVVVGLAFVSFAPPALAESLTLSGMRALVGQKFPEVAFIEVSALARAMHGDPKLRPRLLDTRTVNEYAVSQLATALRVDPDAPDLSVSGTDKALPIVVYCSVGYRSAAIGQRLLRAGFRDVKNLAGGIFAWANAGQPVYRAGRLVREVHPYDALWGLMLREDLRAMHPR